MLMNQFTALSGLKTTLVLKFIIMGEFFFGRYLEYFKRKINPIDSTKPIKLFCNLYFSDPLYRRKKLWKKGHRR